LDYFLELGLSHVERWILGRIGMDVVQNPVRVQDIHGAAGREREHVRRVVTSLLIELHFAGLQVALGAFRGHNRVRDSAAAADDQVLFEVRMQRADFLVLGHLELPGRGRRTVILDGSANRAAGSAREAGANTHAERGARTRRQYNCKLFHYHFSGEIAEMFYSVKSNSLSLPNNQLPTQSIRR